MDFKEQFPKSKQNTIGQLGKPNRNEEASSMLMSTISDITQLPAATNLGLRESPVGDSTFRESIIRYQKKGEHEILDIDELPEHMVVGKVTHISKAYKDYRAELEVGSMTPEGVGILSGAWSDKDAPGLKKAYIRFAKEETPASFCGIIWAYDTGEFEAILEMTRSGDTSIDHDMNKFASILRLDNVWRRGLSKHEPGQRVSASTLLTEKNVKKLSDNLTKLAHGLPVDRSDTKT
jgi:hypothetical protein